MSEEVKAGFWKMSVLIALLLNVGAVAFFAGGLSNRVTNVETNQALQGMQLTAIGIAIQEIKVAGVDDRYRRSDATADFDKVYEILQRMEDRMDKHMGNVKVHNGGSR